MANIRKDWRRWVRLRIAKARVKWVEFKALHTPLTLSDAYIRGGLLLYTGLSLISTPRTGTLAALERGLPINVGLLFAIGGFLYAISNAHGLFAYIGAWLSVGLYVVFLLVYFLIGGWVNPLLLVFAELFRTMIKNIKTTEYMDYQRGRLLEWWTPKQHQFSANTRRRMQVVRERAANITQAVRSWFP